MFQVILASQSPRRKQLLLEEGFEFKTDTVKVSEYIEENVNITQSIIECAERKAKAYVQEHNYLKSQKYLVVSADTVVVFQNQVFGKPTSVEDAILKLETLSGLTHDVVTAVAIYDLFKNVMVAFAEVTKVKFKPLRKSDIEDYVNTGEPMDKAGAYAIQGLGSQFVDSIEGSWSNVVGFPMEKFKKVVAENGWSLPRR
ncbi:MAG: septum formation protein Maf [Bdellovibrionales bacterium]|nr:septum formation protein Maf [Bdellovibrionales bacterium]